MYERGYIKEVGRGESTEFGGRKPIMLTVNEKYGYIISFDIAFHQLHVMSNYIDGTVIDYKQIDTESDDIHAILPLIDQQINDSMQNNKTKKGLLAICFSIHGVVYKNQIKDSPFINMKNVDLYERYSELYSVPVVLENEANLAAIYERDFNDGRDKKNLICISIHKGIGAGIILNRKLYKGVDGSAGEIGRSHLVPGVKTDISYDKVENYYSEEGIINQIRYKKNMYQLTVEDVLDLYKKGDPIVTEELSRFISVLSIIIYNVSVNFAPEAVYVNSPMIELLPNIYEDIVSSLKGLSFEPKIGLINNTHFVTLLGACALSIHSIFKLDNYDLNFKIDF